MYGLGRGVEQNDSEALRWLRKAAEQGDPHAMFNLAALLVKGRGGSVDMDEAITWYRRSAELGHVPSQARLGYLLCGNDGVQKNRVEAFAWLNLASQQGAGHALAALETIVEEMSIEEKRAAQEKIASLRLDWSRSHLKQ
jgi:hypothetical protein